MIEVSAILLAGGRSRRMGADKGQLPFKGRTMLEHQLAKLRGLGIEDIMISGREAALAGTRCVMDVFPDRGPLGGLHACLLAARFPDCLVLSVDTPLVPEAVLGTLLAVHQAGEQSVTLLAHGDQWEPLLAVYRAELADTAARILEAGYGSMHRLIREVPCKLVPYDGPDELIMNCNTPEEYGRALAIAGEAEGPDPWNNRQTDLPGCKNQTEKGEQKMSENKKANGTYDEEQFDTIAFPMMKGSKDILKAHCDATGETYHSFLRRAVVNQIAHDREAMANPDIDPNTRFEGWLHYPDNVKRQIVASLEEWIKDGGKEPFRFDGPTT